jgi:acyl-CoA thioester hydrolase
MSQPDAGKSFRVAAFRMNVPLRWSDLDAFNHVNNARYLTFIEQARIEWLDGIDEPWVSDDYAPVLAQTLLNYRRPIEYPASISVELFTAKLGNSSVTIGHRIVAADGTLHCDGHTVAVWIDRRTGKSRPLPDGVRRASELLLQA